MEQENGVFVCASGYSVAAMSFLDGVVNIGQTGTNGYPNCSKTLIDHRSTCSIWDCKISDKLFFKQSWRGGGTREVKTVKFAVGERGDSKCDVGDIRGSKIKN